MDAKSIALVITFAAVAIVLNAVRIPAVFYPNNFFQLTQIPIVIAFLLFGFKIGVFVGVLNLVGGLVLFPLGTGGLIVYPMDFVSLLLMFVGIWLASKFIARSDESGRFQVLKKPVVGLTAGAIAVRALVMPLVDYVIINRVLIPLILGFQRPEAAIIALVPFFVLYNVIVPLYTIPVAYFVATRVGRYLKIEPRFLCQV